MTPVDLGDTCALIPGALPDRSRWRPCTHHWKRPKCHDTRYRGKAEIRRFCEGAQKARRHWLASLPYWPEPCS